MFLLCNLTACTTQYERYTETLSYGGRQISGATTVEECSNQCDTNPKCVGFDFDINQDQNIRCYTHESFTNYDSRRTAKNVDEYVLTTKTCSNGKSCQEGFLSRYSHREVLSLSKPTSFVPFACSFWYLSNFIQDFVKQQNFQWILLAQHLPQTNK